MTPIIRALLATNILFVTLIIMAVISAYFAVKFIKKFSDMLEGNIVKLNTDVSYGMLEISGEMRRLMTELSDFRRDFNLKFDNELAAKINAILATGHTNPGMMKKFNPETGKEEWVEVDPGW